MTPKFFDRPKLFWVAAAILLLSGAAYSARVGVSHVRSRINEARAEVVKRDAKIADLNGKLEKTTRSTQERMDGYSREVVFLSEQLRDAISPLPLCAGGEIGLTNSSFSPPIGYEVGDQSAKSEHRLVDSGATLLEAVDLTERPMMAAHLSVADGGLHVEVKAPLTGPEFHDLALLVRSGASICKLRARLHFLPARASNGDTYKIVSVISRRGYGLGKFTLPYGTEFRSDNGNLLVSDCINALIQEFGLRGNLVNVYGSFGNFDQQFNRPAAVRFADGKIYVVEENNARFQILSGDGRFLHLGGADSGKLKTQKRSRAIFLRRLGSRLQRPVISLLWIMATTVFRNWARTAA